VKKVRFSDWLAPAFIAAWTALVFWPALGAGFLDWDDGVYIVANGHIRGLTWANLRWMVSTLDVGHYIPLTWLTFAIDYQLRGLDPGQFHATNVLIHSVNAAIFFFVGRELLRRALPDSSGWRLTMAAAASSLFFAVHPLRVESVAWVFERKDVLSGLFYLAAVWAYLRGRRALSLGLFCLSLLSKAIGVSLPIVLLLIDLYPLRRAWSKKLLLEKIPFAAAAALAAAATWLGHERLGATMHWSSFGLGPRLDQCFYGIVFYLSKTVLPLELSPRYLPPSADPIAWPYVASALAACATTLALWGLRRRFPAGWTAWACYAASLLPVLGIIPQSSQIAADRYSYLSCLPWALMFGGLLGRILRSSTWRPAGLAASAAVLLALSAATRAQLRYWRDSAGLWARAVELGPGDALARQGLAKAMAEQGRDAEALAQFQEGLRLGPDNAAMHNDLGAFLASRGRMEEAIGQFEMALQLDPRNEAARINLAKAAASRAGRRSPRDRSKATPAPPRSTN